MAKLGPQFDQAAADWFYHHESSSPLQKAVDNHSIEAPTLYRGTIIRDGKSREDMRKEVTSPDGYTIEPNRTSLTHGQGFSSWSDSDEIAMDFAHERSEREGDKVVYAVSGLRGLDLYKHANTDDVGEDIHLEREWLVPRDQTERIRFKHTVRPNPDTQIFVGRAGH